MLWYMLWHCVCPSQVKVLPKWLSVGSSKLHYTISQGCSFSDAKDLREFEQLCYTYPQQGTKCKWGRLKSLTREMHNFYEM